MPAPQDNFAGPMMQLKSINLKRWFCFLGLAVLIVCAAIQYIREPRIDPQRVTKLDDMPLGSMSCLIFYDPDPRGWPSARNERRYIRYLQDHGISVAFMSAEGRSHWALVGLLDSMKIRQLYEDAKASGIAVPNRVLSSSIEN
jgi:hypothetical protein